MPTLKHTLLDNYCQHYIRLKEITYKKDELQDRYDSVIKEGQKGGYVDPASIEINEELNTVKDTYQVIYAEFKKAEKNALPIIQTLSPKPGGFKYDFSENSGTKVRTFLISYQSNIYSEISQTIEQVGGTITTGMS